MARERTIEELFKSSFNNDVHCPPTTLREGLFNTLDEISVEERYAESFRSEEKSPSPVVWSRISRVLWLTSFMSFNYSKLNIYYVASVVGIAGILSFDFNFDRTTDEIDDQNIATYDSVVNHDVSDRTNYIESIDSKLKHGEELTVISSKSSPKTVVQSTLEVDQEDVLADTGIIDSDITSIQYSILGLDHVCLGNKSKYVVEPFTDEYEIIVNEKSVLKNGFILEFIKEGTQTIRCAKRSSGEIVSEKKVVVTNNVVPEILGSNILCQNKEGQTFRVKSSKDVGIQYVWELNNNDFTVLGNGYISINAINSGVDTAYLTVIDKNTGCVSVAKKGFNIYSNPQARFTYKSRGNLLVEVYIEGSESDISQWFLNDYEVDIVNGTLQFDELGSYELTHIVGDKNGCSSSFQLPITVDDFSLFVPNAFIPETNIDVFKLTGSGLASYKIEIFNVDNLKLWESSILLDGKPFEGWNGYYNGQLQPEGLYYYKICAKFKNGMDWQGIENNGSYSKTGTFYLLGQ